MSLRLTLILLSVLFLQFSQVSTANGTTPGFADSLFNEGDYFRAITEYKRYLYTYPDTPAAARAQLNIARSYLQAERWQDGEFALQRVIDNYPNSDEADIARILSIESAFKQGKPTVALQTNNATTLTHLNLLDQQQRLRIWALAYQGNYSKLSSLDLSGSGCLTQQDLQNLEQLPTKSPALAGTLSAILPGSGQLYAKRYREAGLALLLNAAFIAGGLQAIDTGNEVLGGILLFFEAGWYGGNIYNAMNSVHKYNRTLQQSTLMEMRQRSHFSLLLDDDAAILKLSAPLD
ncbi:tetratricopeptide repeat protein [Desulfuromonas acetoxidans]|uniref:Outer membrane lipoprotein BamD-like domain-containing protein n=1 Tax=Desulfuromonas acetoxidans (strain DSM 684 / 11070) TaxID=281689 RepID=Q1K1V8_DESA6|nr:tetratricopeptide repeat protein [Desulfuromonas acetoxidans]EAT16681.1 hypothetical protein Dace_2776 [Desulfuromonas acetoxidans DSM 684]MBF0645821.1 tetratricopeptide repeat protein [Desulfuromonas acetoxidans]NVD24791.1 tetratricopeptide repeat protein [Desulfuromonas acetoxidans]NVE16836.1 tetratricopeptide repeat protein [Desulfuromonas acetoxidans]